jgi:hypothetical protein
MVECYLDEIIVEVQIFLGLYLTIIIYNTILNIIIRRNIVTVYTNNI